ncbi:DNA polymerase III subunit delta' [Zooshikella marina]|uniref:DNA polymerase III subunit delta' n=1 Tax=Zooshikella ganghwensis TaxID=202772 RepID=UPI001BAFB8BE|nr:DNA polymerase III subunit delta' [Zooshikella ganghwensis]MBU2705194.1 DNA polymerase III subunit delta' [Zooshikella ganghwensis]
MSFSVNSQLPFPWQEKLWQHWSKQHQQGRMAHAYLLEGHKGLGKFHFAQCVASVLLCTSLTDGLACRACKSCQLLQAKSHPDLLVVTPEQEGKPIRVDQVRQLLGFASKTAQQGGYRVIIIYPADAMNINASNALLKCLEEPGDNTVILLITDTSSGLLPTIKSRCQRLQFTLPDPQSGINWLMAQESSLTQESATFLLNLASQAPLLACDYYQKDALAIRQQVLEGVKAITKRQVSPVSLAKQWQSIELSLVLTWLLDWLSDMIKISQLGCDRCCKNKDVTPMLTYIANKAGIQALYQYYDWLLIQRQHLLNQGNLNLPLLIEGVLIRWRGLTQR